MTNYRALKAKIEAAQRELNSPLLTEVIEALDQHPATIGEGALEEARQGGAISMLRDVIHLGHIVRQKGHPEEETRELDNTDISRLAHRSNVSLQKVWAK